MATCGWRRGERSCGQVAEGELGYEVADAGRGELLPDVLVLA